MNYLELIIASLAGTVAMTLMMTAAPKMGLPTMDIVGMISRMLGFNRILALVMHLMMGAIFAIIYGFFGFTSELVPALLFGTVHWLIVGAIGPAMQKENNPGLYMIKEDGPMGFVGGLLGHWVFAIATALTLNLF